MKKTGRGGGTGKGLPHGYKFPATLEKAAAKELVRSMVYQELAPLVEAQIKHAKGTSFFVRREKGTGKFTRVKADDLLRDEDVHEVWDKEPSVPAFTDLLNRALDKPTESLEILVQPAKKLSDAELYAKLAALMEKYQPVINLKKNALLPPAGKK